jgi:hypothetical protein
MHEDRKATDKGGMLPAALDPVRAKAYIVEVYEALPTGSLEIACINSPRNVTISGKLESMPFAISSTKRMFLQGSYRSIMLTIQYT